MSVELPKTLTNCNHILKILNLLEEIDLHWVELSIAYWMLIAIDSATENNEKALALYSFGNE